MVRTRELLIDVARQLFARKGVAATTMNDIAEASGKGRRTIYTYFKNKNEIYWAVVEAESEHLYARLEGLANRDLPPEEKLLNYINTRLEAVKEAVVRNGTLRAEFFRDILKVEKARRSIDVREEARGGSLAEYPYRRSGAGGVSYPQRDGYGFGVALCLAGARCALYPRQLCRVGHRPVEVEGLHTGFHLVWHKTIRLLTGGGEATRCPA